jgi:alpha-glucosidase (family GH31 glycosyl hydrolase)
MAVVTRGSGRRSRTATVLLLRCAVLLILTVLATSALLWVALLRGHGSGPAESNAAAHSTPAPVRKRAERAADDAAPATPAPVTPGGTANDAGDTSRSDAFPMTEAFFDETCTLLQQSAAMNMGELRFGVQRYEENVLAFEVFTERDAMTARGRKRTIERAQYIPDDVVVLDPKKAERMISYKSHRLRFAPKDGSARPLDSDTIRCDHGGDFVVPFGPEEKLAEAQLTYEHVGKLSDLHPADLGAPNRQRLARIGRVHEFKEGGARIRAVFKEPTSFYGAGNRGRSVELPLGVPIRARNLDINHYQLDESVTLYGVVPLVYAVSRRTMSTCGILVLNGSPMQITTKDQSDDISVTFETSDGGTRFFFLRGPTPADVLRQYYAVTGRPMLPPRFSLGFHQSRWSYLNEQDVTTVNSRFDAAGLPCDVLWLDIDHTDGKRYFTWDQHSFPRPKDMQAALGASGRRLVCITDPHIKRDEGYPVFVEATAHSYFVADETGTTEFVGDCWPGLSSWIDFINPQARKWYSSLFAYDRYHGSTDRLYTWIDMNEPSVFPPSGGPEYTMPNEARHVNNIPHRQVHNLYGFYHAMAAAQGHLHRSQNEQRPFVLTRSFFAGTQRYAAVWTGDNQARWDHLAASVDMVLMMSLSGITFVGADVGGFFGFPDQELLHRWFQLGCLYPFFRQHSDDKSERREPYLHQGEMRRLVAGALIFRYQILPYLYTVFAETAGVIGPGGSSVARHLMLVFPEDALSYHVTDTFMVGDALLARPVTAPAGQLGKLATYSAFIPRRSPASYEIDRRPEAVNAPLLWYSFCSGLHYSREGTGDPRTAADDKGRMTFTEEVNCPVPLLQRAGTIVPFKLSVGKSTDTLHEHPTELRVALDVGDYAAGVLYLDDGLTNAYSTNDARCAIRLEASRRRVCARAGRGDCPNYVPADFVTSIRIHNATRPKWTTATVIGLGKGHDGLLAKFDVTHTITTLQAQTETAHLPLARPEKAASIQGEAPDTLWCVEFSE